MSTQKQRWAARSATCEQRAARLQTEAAAMLEGRNRDPAYISQPGHIPSRARDIARADRAFAMMGEAKALRDKAANLSRLASRQAGDAEREREAKRQAVQWHVGQTVRAVLYGPAVVERVNAKTLRLRLPSGGVITEDKCRVRSA